MEPNQVPVTSNIGLVEHEAAAADGSQSASVASVNPKALKWASYEEESQKWRRCGTKVILAQYDADSVVVYQAYNGAIAQFAVANKRFEGAPGFNNNRMTWVKTNFLWAMYRSGWAKKSNQDHILAIWLKREAYEELLRASKHSSEQEREEATKNGTRILEQKSPNRIQWDPQHSPDGEKLRQRALQLGVKDVRYNRGDWILDIQDVTDRVKPQRDLAMKQSYPWKGLLVPVEDVYPIADQRLARHLALDTATEQAGGHTR